MTWDPGINRLVPVKVMIRSADGSECRVSFYGEMAADAMAVARRWAEKTGHELVEEPDEEAA